MKKRKLKNLNLNKKTINSFDVSATKGGGWTDGHWTCGCTQGCPTQAADCDIPTIRDSCFSVCDDRCNDW